MLEMVRPAWLALASCSVLAACVGEEPCDLAEPGTMCTVAGSGEEGWGEDEAVALEAPLSLPVDLAAGPEGRLYLLDFNNLAVRRLDLATGVMSRVVGSGQLGSGCPGGGAGCDSRQLEMNHATSIAFDGRDMIVAGWHGSVLWRIDIDRWQVVEVIGRGTRGEYDGDGGPAHDAAWDLPGALAVLPDGGLLVTDQGNQVIRRIGPDGIVHRFAGGCVVDQLEACAPDQEPAACPDSDKLTCGDPAASCLHLCNPAFAGDGGPALEARLGLPTGSSADPSGRLAVRDDGTVLVADTWNRRIRAIGPDGVIDTVVGSGEDGWAGDGGPARGASLSHPTDLALAADGTLYIADPLASCVRAVSPGGVIDTVAGVCGERGFAGDGGPATEALLDRPYGLELHGGVLYVADTLNHRVRAVRVAR